jgi:tRNA threonylcarbamoyladenosine biosynthesis protein TsaB
MNHPPSLEASHALAFDTSSAIGSVALGRGPDILDSRRLTAPFRHAAQFVPTIEALCRDHGVAPAGVRCVFVSIGPGSFTGLRIGVAVARAMALALEVGIVAVPTLEAIAQNAMDLPTPPRDIAVLLDAKRKNVYACAFALDDGRYRTAGDPAEVEPAAFLARQPSTCAVLGEGIAQHREVVEASGLEILPVELHAARAEAVYRLGWLGATEDRFTPARQLVPHYVRPPEAEEKRNRRTDPSDG